MNIYLIYMGKDKGSIYGVPARNLSEEEAGIHGEKRLIDSGLYVLANPKPRETVRKKRTYHRTDEEIKE